MKRLTVLATLALALMVVAGCATMNTGYHLDPTAPFDHYVTYKWGPPDNLPVGDPRLDNNPFFVDYLQGAVEKNLAGKGYVYDAIDPDLLIHYHASVNQLDVYGGDKSAAGCTANANQVVVRVGHSDARRRAMRALTKCGARVRRHERIIDNQDRLSRNGRRRDDEWR